MPYITEKQRKELDDFINILSPKINSDGELNYVVTKLCLKFAKPNDQSTSYNLINSTIGVLECAKLEFYRRLAASYEDDKIKRNGDVY